MPKERLENQIYARAIESLVIVCTDIIMVCRGKNLVYLAKRRQKPLLGWWMIGGRMRAGEDYLESAQRYMYEEAGMKIEKNRFEYVTTNRYWCKDRQQIPQEIGSDSEGHIFSLEVSDEELKSIALNLDEYEYDRKEGIREFSRETLIAAKIHPAIIDIYNKIFR